MTSLLETQRRFYRAVRAGEASRMLCTGSAAGMDVYRNNLRVGSRKALTADYPVIERLVGPQCFSYLSTRYADAHPSRSGDLQDFCRSFPSFLRSYYGNSRFAYLADVAELELAVTEALSAASVATLAPAALAAWSPQALIDARLVLAPCVRTWGSPYPILTIWRQNQKEADCAGTVDLDQGGECALIYRCHGEVMLERLASEQMSFLAALARGMSLCDASQIAQSEAVEFDLQQMLFRLFTRPLISALVGPAHGDVE